MSSPPDLERVLKERDLYRRLLELGSQDDLGPVLREAMRLMVEIAGARQGYLELYEEDVETPRWSMSHGFSQRELDDVRSLISTGIVTEAIASGETIVTRSAFLDPRFSARRSVVDQKIEAVLCAPIGAAPPVGVIYLQGREKSGLFDPDEKSLAETFARHLAPLVDRLRRQSHDRSSADPTADLRARFNLSAVVGRSEALAHTLREAAVAFPVNFAVLLTGECGTGKSQLARVIHDNSPRAPGPFVELNCAALPASTLEMELFGSVPGAFTDARDYAGKVAAAEGGTLFLDEIGEIPVESQAKLLQLLHSKQYYPLGSSEPRRANVRIIAATNVDLQRAIEEKRFREDLFFRLNVLTIRVPTLAERREDVRGLMRHLCGLASAKNDLPRFEISHGAFRAAESAPWPGNVRELANAVELAAARAASEGASQIEAHHLFSAAAARASGAKATYQQATREFQARLLKDTLDEHDWNVSLAARELDLARAHVYNLIRLFELRRP